ncbi:MAG TPA: hypothetical protein VGA42_07080 [Gemmatimonadales bacterium]
MSITHRCRSLARIGMAGGLTALAIGCTEKRVDPTAAPFAEFTRRVDEYVALHNAAAEKVGPLDETKSQAEIAARAVALGYAIAAARPQAKQGDIFTIEIATVFATMIHEEYSRRPPPVLDTREDTQEELPDFVPKVNELYPTTYPLATFPPSLLPLLPRLPEDIVEYRIVQKYLILRDVEANLIIDFMPNALP